MPALPRTLALVVLLASLVAAAPAAAGTPHATAVLDPATPESPPAAAIPAPLCGVPADAGVLALVPPPTASGDDDTDGSDDDSDPNSFEGTGDETANATPDPAVGTTRTAVVDRFEGDTAVLLVEARGDVVARRLVRRRALPRAARHQDAVVTVTVLADSVAAIEYQPVETVRRSQEARRRFERLSGAGSGGGPAVC